MKMGKANTFVYLQDSTYQTFFPIRVRYLTTRQQMISDISSHT